jgi:hypothetical protein
MLVSSNITPSRIADLEALLKGLDIESPEKRVYEYRALIEALGQRDEVTLLIQSILSNPALLAIVAGRSYPHVNKFDKIVLVGSNEPQAYRLTLHLWQPPYSEGVLRQEMIHDHRFNFWSAIVTGTLSSEIFEKDDASLAQNANLKVYRQYRYVPEATRGLNFQDFYEFQGCVNLLSTGMREDRAGASYYLDARTIHRIILPRKAITCSLVLRGPRLKGYSRVYNTSYPRRNTILNNKMFSVRDLEHRLCQLVSALERTTD